MRLVVYLVNIGSYGHKKVFKNFNFRLMKCLSCILFISKFVFLLIYNEYKNNFASMCTAHGHKIFIHTNHQLPMATNYVSGVFFFIFKNSII